MLVPLPYFLYFVSLSPSPWATISSLLRCDPFKIRVALITLEQLMIISSDRFSALGTRGLLHSTTTLTAQRLMERERELGSTTHIAYNESMSSGTFVEVASVCCVKE